MAIFSGAAQDMWDAPTKENCEERAASLGLAWTDSASFKAALMGANADGLRSGWQIIGESAFDSMLCDWAPVIDSDFFPSSGTAMRAATQPKAYIFGIYFLESAGMLGAITLDSHTVEKIVDFMGTPNRTQFQSYFLEQYRNQAAILEPTAVDKHAAMAVFGERTFAATMDAVLRDATHSFDQRYALGLPGFTFAGDDQTVVDLYTTALANFAKTGNPNGTGASALSVEWKKATPANPYLNYVIETTPYMDAQFFYGRPNLNNILNKIAGTFRPVYI